MEVVFAALLRVEAFASVGGGWGSHLAGLASGVWARFDDVEGWGEPAVGWVVVLDVAGGVLMVTGRWVGVCFCEGVLNNWRAWRRHGVLVALAGCVIGWGCRGGAGAGGRYGVCGVWWSDRYLPARRRPGAGFEDQEVSSCAASVAVTPETFLITTTGALDLDAIDPFEDALSQAAQSLSRCTVLDLSRVTFADSTCLNVLLAARAAHAAARRPWAIAGPYAHQIRRLLAVTGADRVLPLAPDLPAARRLAGYPDDEGPGTAPVAAA